MVSTGSSIDIHVEGALRWRAVATLDMWGIAGR